MSDRLVARRSIAAPSERVFSVLADPAQHQHTEPGDWVRGPLEDDPPPITAVGQHFGMEMFHPGAGGRYEVENLVTAFDPDRTIEWEPGQRGPDGHRRAGGWRWRYDLRPDGDGTEVILTYDWTAVPPPVREEIGFPPFPAAFLDESLACLDAHVRPGAGRHAAESASGSGDGSGPAPAGHGPVTAGEESAAGSPGAARSGPVTVGEVPGGGQR